MIDIRGELDRLWHGHVGRVRGVSSESAATKPPNGRETTVRPSVLPRAADQR